jgi:hypothetical protein
MEKRDHEQPDRTVAKAAQRLVDGERSRERCRGDPKQSHRTDWQWLRDNSNNGRHKNSQEMPSLGLDAARWGD